MNILFSCIGKRGYIAEYFREHLDPGEKIIGTSNTEWTPGFRECDLGLLLPPIASDEYVPAVIETCRKHDIGGLLSFYDPDVVALSGHVDALRAAGVVPLIPSEPAARIGFDKWKTFRTLREAGFRVPDTAASLDEAFDGLRAGRFRFPLVVKPRAGFASDKTFIASGEAQLAAFFSVGPDMLIQEFVNGDEHGIAALSDPERRVVHVVAWRKLLMRMGETEHAVTVDDPELIEVGQRLAETVGLVGPMDVDLFRTRDGTVRVLEFNPRFGGGYPAAHFAGADFPRMIMEIFRGRRPEPRIGEYRRDVCMIKGLRAMGGPAERFLPELRSGAAE